MARVHQFLLISPVINFNLKPWLLYIYKVVNYWPRILDRLTTGSDLVCPAQLNVLPKKFQQFEGKGRLREPFSTQLVVSQSQQTPSKKPTNSSTSRSVSSSSFHNRFEHLPHQWSVQSPTSLKMPSGQPRRQWCPHSGWHPSSLQVMFQRRRL